MASAAGIGKKELKIRKKKQKIESATPQQTAPKPKQSVPDKDKHGKQALICQTGKNVFPVKDAAAAGVRICEDSATPQKTQTNNAPTVFSSKERQQLIRQSVPATQQITQKGSNFNGSLVRVLSAKHEIGNGFEKTVERKAILFSNGRYYLQDITRCVVAEGNGRPITRYSEYVYPISTTNIDVITPENVYEHIELEPAFENIKSSYGIDF